MLVIGEGATDQKLGAPQGHRQPWPESRCLEIILREIQYIRVDVLKIVPIMTLRRRGPNSSRRNHKLGGMSGAMRVVTGGGSIWQFSAAV